MKRSVGGGTGNIRTRVVKLLHMKRHDVTCFNQGKDGDVTEGAKAIIGDRPTTMPFG